MTRRTFLALAGLWLCATLMIPLPIGRWVLLLALIWMAIATLPMVVLAVADFATPALVPPPSTDALLIYAVTSALWILYLLYRGTRHLRAGRERNAFASYALALSTFAPIVLFAFVIATMPALGS